MDMAIHFPQAQVLFARALSKQRALQRHVITRHHGETIERQNIATLYLAAGHRVVCAVGVHAGLKPRPRIHQFRMGPDLRNLAHHGLRGMQSNLMLGNTNRNCFDTKIGNVGRVKNKLLRGLRAGAILLLHDGNAARTAEGTPVILEVLPAVLASAIAADLRFITLRQAIR